MKVNKEEMLGMLAALERYLAERSRGASGASSTRAPRRSAAAWRRVPGVKAEIFVPEVANHVPHVRISWDAAAKGLTADDAVNALRDGEPSIGTRSEGDALVIGVWMMQPGEEKIVARRLREVLAKGCNRARSNACLMKRLATPRDRAVAGYIAGRRRRRAGAPPSLRGSDLDGVRVRHRGVRPRRGGTCPASSTRRSMRSTASTA